MSEKVTPRPELGRFAELMEVVLRDNDYKGGWSAMTPEEIVNRMFDELRELDRAVFETNWNQSGGIHLPDWKVRQIRKEAADVANFAMMLCDALKAKLRQSDEHRERIDELIARSGYFAEDAKK